MKKGLSAWPSYALGILLIGVLAACAAPAARNGAANLSPEPRSNAVAPSPREKPQLFETATPFTLEARPASFSGPLAGEPFQLREDGPADFQYHARTARLPLEKRLSQISREVAGRVYYGLGNENISSSARVAVVAAVPLSDLKRESEFGRVMAEYLLTDLADRGLRVTELRLGRDIHIVPQTGEFILSRNVGELANHRQELDYVVVSTFSNTRQTLMLHGRLVDLQNGAIRTSWRHSLPLEQELLDLFHEEGMEAPFTVSVRGVL